MEPIRIGREALSSPIFPAQLSNPPRRGAHQAPWQKGLVPFQFITEFYVIIPVSPVSSFFISLQLPQLSASSHLLDTDTSDRPSRKDFVYRFAFPILRAYLSHLPISGFVCIQPHCMKKGVTCLRRRTRQKEGRATVRRGLGFEFGAGLVHAGLFLLLFTFFSFSS